MTTDEATMNEPKLIQPQKLYLVAGGRFARIDDTIWPNHKSFAIDEIGWELRHAPDSVSKEDMLTAASVIEAYRALIEKPRCRREMICKALRDLANTR